MRFCELRTISLGSRDNTIIPHKIGLVNVCQRFAEINLHETDFSYLVN